MPIAVVNRYARALADAVGVAGDYRATLGELVNFAAVYRESPELGQFFESPAVALPVKTNVLESVLARLGATTMTRNFLRVLLQNYRMAILEGIVQAFRKTVNARLGIVEVKIASAAELTEAERETLRARFVELTRKQVALDFHLDGELLGGIRAQIESTVYDGSVRGQLDRIRQQLMAR